MWGLLVAANRVRLECQRTPTLFVNILNDEAATNMRTFGLRLCFAEPNPCIVQFLG
jgi:hypothetical protein